MSKPGVMRLWALLDSTVKLMFSFITVQVVFILIYFTQIHLFSLETEHLVFYFNFSSGLPVNAENLIWVMYVVNGIALLLHFLASQLLNKVGEQSNQVNLSLHISWLLFFLIHQVMLVLALDIIFLVKLDLMSIYTIPYIFPHIILRIVVLMLFIVVAMLKRERWKTIFSLQSRNWSSEARDSLKAHLLISWGVFFLLFFALTVVLQRFEWFLYCLFLNIVLIPVIAFLPQSGIKFSKR